MQGSDTPRSQHEHTQRVSLKQGERGEAVRQLQYQLGRIGYHDIDQKLRTDGDFGDRTRRAVEAFQYDYGLTVDGIVGFKTATALKHAEYAHRSFSASSETTKKTGTD